MFRCSSAFLRIARLWASCATDTCVRNRPMQTYSHWHFPRTPPPTRRSELNCLTFFSLSCNGLHARVGVLRCLWIFTALRYQVIIMNEREGNLFVCQGLVSPVFSRSNGVQLQLYELFTRLIHYFLRKHARTHPAVALLNSVFVSVRILVPTRSDSALDIVRYRGGYPDTVSTTIREGTTS